MALVFGVMTAIVDLPYIVMQHDRRLAYAVANAVALVGWVLIGFCVGVVIDATKRRRELVADAVALAEQRRDEALRAWR